MCSLDEEWAMARRPPGLSVYYNVPMAFTGSGKCGKQE